MATVPIAFLRDDFADNIQAQAWSAAGVVGSATKNETGGQAVFTLPSSTAGTHAAWYQSATTYDLTGDGFTININTMVSTSVAATAFFQLILDSANYLQWTQTNGTLKAQKIVAGVTTDVYSVAWNATTYKYLRIRESSGTISFDSSTNGTTWTNRGSIVGLPFAITDLTIKFGALCGNVASPGSFRLDDVNMLLGVTSTVRSIIAKRETLDYIRTITIAATSGQGYIATAQTTDATGALVSPRYFAGPIGSSSGGYNQLTEYTTQAAAQAMAVNLPTSFYARWDLPQMVQCRFVQLYHRSTTGSSYRLDEFYPRRLVQADDIEAESIRTINLAAGAVTADKIYVLQLSALTASMGALHMDGVIDITATGGIYQGSGSFASPTTGLKLYNSAGIGRLAGYNAGIEQAAFDSDGRIKAGANAISLDVAGMTIIANAMGSYTYSEPRAVTWETPAGLRVAALEAIGSGSGTAGQNVLNLSIGTGSIPILTFSDDGINVNGVPFQVASSTLDVDGNTKVAKLGGVLTVGTALGAGNIDVAGGLLLNGNVKVAIKGATNGISAYGIAAYSNAGSTGFFVRDDGLVFGKNLMTALGHPFDIGGYTAGTVTQAGYITVVIDGTTRRLLVG